MIQSTYFSASAVTDRTPPTIHSYGVPPLETLRSMSGLAFLEAIIAGRLPSPPITEVLRFRLVEVGRGRAVFEGTPGRDFYNPIGSVHGGYAATLLDSCMGCAVHSTLPQGQGYATLEIKVNMVRALTEATGAVRAEGRILHTGRTTATAEGRLTDAAGKLYGHGTTTCAVFGI
ncbi:MAG: PaaI family thioesterase [Alphaproteobacteria bacterium]|nr:PaaI family thioesterase [Alphaproteobacteria bacterium]